MSQALLNKIWYESHPLGLPLRPVSTALGVAVKGRQLAYQKGWISQFRAPVPVVVIGNISVGGTGKTPFLIWLGKRLLSRGIRIGIISRGYKSNGESAVVEVNADKLPEQVGDEPYMIYQHLQCPMVVGANRAAAIGTLLATNQIDLILSDDGMQHYAMARDMEIALVDGMRGLGNGRLLPAGPLREPPSRLGSVDFVVSNTKAYLSHPVMSVSAFDAINISCGTRKPLSEFAGQTNHAVAGIGNPQRFFNTLQAHNIKTINHAFSDHHVFTASDVSFPDDLPVLMTEKDAVKCRKITTDKLWYVPVEAVLPSTFETQLLAAIDGLLARYDAAK